ncbi:MAG: DUF4293 domain-containing protein [Bacteroidota bacterium]|nr:DUF4293 domain-containing protein [Bacteroidota bacterium]
MIQRIQSLYLLCVVIIHAALNFVPLWEGSGPNGQNVIVDIQNVRHFHDNSQEMAFTQESMWLTGLNWLIVILGIITIFLYKKRLRQLRLSRLLAVASSGFIALQFYIIEMAKSLFTSGIDESSYEFGAFLPIAGLILIVLAGMAILRDERLVRSADRLR